MSNDALAGGVKPEGGAAPDLAELKKLIHDTINDVLPKAVHARVTRTEETLAELVKAELGKLSSAQPQEKKEPATDSEKLTLKALQDQIAQLNKGIEAERKARSEAENAAVRTRKDAEVRSHFARHLQGDAARHMDPYLKFYGDDFQVKDGVVGRVVKGEYGDEQFVPVNKAVDDLFAGDLKHLIQQSKAGNLPPVGARGAQGQPVSRLQPSETRPFFMDEVVSELAKDRPEVASSLLQQAPNGTAK